MGGACSSSSYSLQGGPPSLEELLQDWQADLGQSSLELRWIDFGKRRLRRILHVMEQENGRERMPLTSLTVHQCTLAGAQNHRAASLALRSLRQFFTFVATTQQVDTLDLSHSSDALSDETLLHILRLWSSTTGTRKSEIDIERCSISTTLSGKSDSFILEHPTTTIPLAKPQLVSATPLVSLNLSGHWIEDREIWRTLQQEFPALQEFRFNSCYDVPTLHCFIQGAFFSATNDEEPPSPDDESSSSPPSHHRTSSSSSSEEGEESSSSSAEEEHSISRGPNRDIIPQSRPFWPALQHLHLDRTTFTLGNFRQLVVGLCCGPAARGRQQEQQPQDCSFDELLVSPLLLSSAQQTNLLSGRRVLRWLQHHHQRQLQDEDQPCCSSASSRPPPPPIALKSLSLRGASDLGVTALSWLTLLVAHQPCLEELNLKSAPDLFQSWAHTSANDVQQLQREHDEEERKQNRTVINHWVPPRRQRGRRRMPFHVLEDDDDDDDWPSNIENFRYRHLKQPFFECFAHAVGKHGKLKKLNLLSSLRDNDMAMALFRHLEQDEHGHHKPSLQILDVSRNNMGEFALVQFITSLPHMSSLRTVDMWEVPFLGGLTASQRKDLVTALYRNHSLCDFHGAPQWLCDYPMPSALTLSGADRGRPHESSNDQSNSTTNNPSSIPFLKSMLSRNRALRNAGQMLQSVEHSMTNLMALEPEGDHAESAAYASYVTSAWPVWLEQLADNNKATPPSSLGRNQQAKWWWERSSISSSIESFGAGNEGNEEEHEQDSHLQEPQEPQEPPPSWVASSYYMVLQSQQWDWIPASPLSTSGNSPAQEERSDFFFL